MITQSWHTGRTWTWRSQCRQDKSKGGNTHLFLFLSNETANKKRWDKIFHFSTDHNLGIKPLQKRDLDMDESKSNWNVKTGLHGNLHPIVKTSWTKYFESEFERKVSCFHSHLQIVDELVKVQTDQQRNYKVVYGYLLFSLHLIKCSEVIIRLHLHLFVIISQQNKCLIH